MNVMFWPVIRLLRKIFGLKPRLLADPRAIVTYSVITWMHFLLAAHLLQCSTQSRLAEGWQGQWFACINTNIHIHIYNFGISLLHFCCFDLKLTCNCFAHFFQNTETNHIALLNKSNWTYFWDLQDVSAKTFLQFSCLN